MSFIFLFNFWRLKLTKWLNEQNSTLLNWQEMAFIEILNFTKLISRKICVTEKSCNLHTEQLHLHIWKYIFNTQFFNIGLMTWSVRVSCKIKDTSNTGASFYAYVPMLFTWQKTFTLQEKSTEMLRKMVPRTRMISLFRCLRICLKNSKNIINPWWKVKTIIKP